VSQIQVRLLEQAPIAQALKADQQRVASKGRETLVRGITVSGWIHRQHLPQLLPGSTEEIGEFVGARAQIANAELTRQRSEVQQDSTRSRRSQAATIYRLAASVQGRRNPGWVPFETKLSLWGQSPVIPCCSIHGPKAVPFKLTHQPYRATIRREIKLRNGATVRIPGES